VPGDRRPIEISNGTEKGRDIGVSGKHRCEHATASPVASAARQGAGPVPDLSAATAVARSAATLRATLTLDSVTIAGAGDARDYAPVASPPRNHLNCGTVGTVMRGGAIGATLEAFPIPLGSVA
jgi:hypothetical protein